MKHDLVSKTQGKTKPETPASSLIPVRLPVTVHSVSLVVLALCAAIFMLHWAREVLIPLMLGVMISYALSPLGGHAAKMAHPAGHGGRSAIARYCGKHRHHGVFPQR